MKITGEELYNLYCATALEVSDTQNDPWHVLDTLEKNTWDALAEKLDYRKS